jgi:predicted Zn finger-like uncharacterized protein
MKIVCDACSAKYSIADEKVRGKVFKIRCKKCSNIIVVRGAVSEQGDAAAPPYDAKQAMAAGDSQRADSAAEVSESAVWHLVIDQEQVGPMTVEEVRDRIQRGEVDSEGFVWREGFGDWERLADVEEFSSMVGGAVAGNGGVGVLFGGSSGAEYDEARAAQNDPADLFATRGDDAGAAADLFAGTGLGPSAEASADPDGLFGGDGGLGVGDAPEKPVVAALTAQRNENSVLFSLNNLAALASDAPRPAPAPAPASSPSGSGSMASVAASKAPQSEGSGLIDIRSMAQVYLGDTKSPSKPVGSADDHLPVFSQTAFESASPVLLPTVQPAVNNRLLIALIGLIGVLVAAAVVLVVIVLRGGGDRAQVAAADPATTAAPAPAATAPSAPAGEPTAPVAAAPAGEPSGGEAAAPAAAPAAADDSDKDKDEPAADDSSDDAKTASRDKDRDQKDRKDRKDRDRDRDRKDRDKDKDKGRDKRRSGGDSGDTKTAAAPAPDPTATSGCDEVTCLVEPDKPCCKKYSRRSSGGSSRSSGSADPNLPDQPSRSDVASGIGNVKGNVSACGSRSPGGGKVTVKIKISPAGSVSSASASGGSSSLNGCVESAVRRARFPKSQYGVSVNYPFIF